MPLVRREQGTEAHHVSDKYKPAMHDECAQCGAGLLVADRAWRGMVSDWGLVLSASYCYPEEDDPIDETGKPRSVCYRLATEEPEATAAVVAHLREVQARLRQAA